MAKTQAEKEAFLRSNYRKIILIELEYHDGTSLKTEYIANAPYISGPADTLANQAYEEAVIALPQIVARDSDDASYGRLVFARLDHMTDFLDYSFDGHGITFYIGRADWSRDDFFEIFSGVTAGISAPDSGSLAVTFFDKRERLRVDFQQDNFYDDGTPWPVCIGPVFNGTARMIDKALYKFRYHENGNLTVTAVRDRGVDLGSAFTDNGDGTFTLDAAPTDTNGADITFDVEYGETDGTPAAIIEYLALRSDLTSSDIDSASFTAFGSTAVLSRYVTERTSIQSLINEVEVSVNAKARFNLAGKLELVKRYEIPSAQAIDFDEDDIVFDSLGLVETIKPVGEVTFTYARNETPQSPDSLAGAVSDANRELYTTPHQTVSTTNSGVLTEYPNTTPAVFVPTWHTSQIDAQAACDHYAAWLAQKRKVYRGTFIASPYLVAIGDGASVTVDRLGFDAGKNVQIVGKKMALDSRQTALEFVI